MHIESIDLVLVPGCLFILLLMWFLIVTRIRHHFHKKRSENSVLLKVSVPLNNKILPDAAEALFTELHGVYKGDSLIKKIISYFTGQEVFSFEIVAIHENISFFLFVPKSSQKIIENALYAQYASALIEPVWEYELFYANGATVFSELIKKNISALPIHTYRDTLQEGGFQKLEDVSTDFLSAITNAMVNLKKNESIVVQLLIRPASNHWQQQGKKLVRKIHRKTFSFGKKIGQKLTSGEEQKEKLIEGAISRVGFETCLRIISTSTSEEKARTNEATIKAAFASLNYEDCNQLILVESSNRQALFDLFINRYFPPFTTQRKWHLPYAHRTSIFNTAELATLYHLPNEKIKTPNLSMMKAKRAAAPEQVITRVGKGGVILGYNDYRNVKTEIGIERDDRRRHIYCIGKTGMGKSTLAVNMIYQDIINGEGCCFIDPHGDTIEQILSLIPKHRIQDTILFDAGDIELPIGLNLLEYHTPEQKDFVVNEFVNILNKLFAQFMDPMFEHIARNCLMTIAENPVGGTLVEMTRVLTDKRFRTEMLKHVTNPMVKAFWKEEMAQTVEFHISEILGPVISKFGRFISNDIMRNIIGQSKSGINIRDVMDQQKILLINLAKGKIGQINTQLLGMIFVTKFLMHALSRVEIPEKDRKDFYLYVDEFQNFTSDTFTTILSEARKYRLNLYITHQYLGQLRTEKKKSILASESEREADEKRTEKEMIESVLGNVGTLMFMRVGAPDAEVVAKELKPVFDETDVINVDKYMVYVKLLINGVTSRPFSMHCYPPPKVDYNFTEEIRHHSRHQYGKTRAAVEQEIYTRGMFDSIGADGPAKGDSSPY